MYSAELDWARQLCDDLGEIFCLTFVKGVDEAEALRRMGGYPDTLQRRTADELEDLMEDFDEGFPRMAAALRVSTWSVVIEPDGYHGADVDLLKAVSRGTEAVSVLCHGYASDRFSYAVDGSLIGTFEPGYPSVYGDDPDRLRELMQRAGIRMPTGDDDNTWADAVPRALALARSICGVRVPGDPLAVPRLSAVIEPWFATGATVGDLLRAGASPGDRDEPALVSAAEAAGPDVQRAVAVAEARRQAAALGLADTPGLADALAAALRAAPPAGAPQAGAPYPAALPAAAPQANAPAPVSVDSPLGRHVRTWIQAGDRASWSLNGPYRHRMTDAERSHGYALGWFVAALRGVLDPDPRVAVLAALKPLTSGIAVLGDRAVRDAVLRALRGEVSPGTY